MWPFLSNKKFPIRMVASSLGILMMSSCASLNTSTTGRTPDLYEPASPSRAEFQYSKLSARDEQELDTYLASTVAMKKDLEGNARSLKRDFQTDPGVQAKAEEKYGIANAALGELRTSMKSDFITNSGNTSQVTLARAKQFQSAANDVRFYYAEVSNQGKYGTALILVVDVLKELLNLWSTYSQAQKQAYVNAIDSRLVTIPWRDL